MKMESNDPSIERRRREYASAGAALNTMSPQHSSALVTLSDFFNLMIEKRIDGPHEQTDIHLIGKHLGSGAQFDVYGHQHVIHPSVASFDEPYASILQKASDTAGYRPVVVAIKRPRFKFRLGSSGFDYEPPPSMSFGSPTQLRALELEIRALCHESIRSHRNIVRLLAWGVEKENFHTRGLEPLAPFLVLEHGNCSLHRLLADDTGTIPWQVLQRLALDVSQGLSILHASKIIHGDLKTDNVLVFPTSEGPFFCIAKLSDFGLSVFDQTEGIFDIGTPGWQAPELPSDEGLDAEMLVKCDYFSLGLVILSTFLTHGLPPLRGLSVNSGSALEFAKSSLVRSHIPPSAGARISTALESLLQHRPGDRVSDLESVCHLLAYTDEEPFDTQGSWVNGRFYDNTPWGELLQSSYGKTMILGIYSDRELQFMAQRIPSQDFVSSTWVEIHTFLCQWPTIEYSNIANYYIGNIDRIIGQRTPEENLSMDIIGQEITGHQLLGLCFTDRIALMLDRSNLEVNSHRVARRLRGSCAAVAATKGYFPAQAVALKLLEDTSSKYLERVRANDASLRWQWNAVSTGYILAWKFAHENPEEYESALRSFRKSGGYNSHYICPVPKNNLIYATSGLLHNPLAWLTGYPLHHAAVYGDVAELERLLKSHHVDSVDSVGETALQRACMAGAFTSVRYLIQHGADPTIQSKRLGTVPLHWLFVFEPKEVYDTAILLTSKGKSVLSNFSTPGTAAFHCPFEWPAGTPLEWAVLSNRSEAVNVLLELGSTLDSAINYFPGPPNWNKQVYGVNPEDTVYGLDGMNIDPNRKLWSFWIYYTMEQYRLPVIQNSPSYQTQFKYLSSGNLGGQQGRRETKHIFNTYGGDLNTAILENDFDALKQLIDLGADVNYSTRVQGSEKTVLMTAIGQENLDMVRLLLDHGALLNGDNYPAPMRPLRSAVHQNNLEIVKTLLERGAEVNARSEPPHGTALLGAILLDRLPTVKLLLQYNANPLIECEGCRSVLETAVLRGNSEIVDLVLERGGNPNTPGVYDQIGNAIQQAAYYGNARILRSLLDKGGDPSIRGGLYETAIQAAINPSTHRMWKHQTAVVQLLLERGVDVTINGGKYGSVMQAAACSADSVLAELLLEAGAPVNIGGGPHGSALQAAVSWNDDLRLVELLLDHGADPDFGGDEKWDSPLQLAVHRGNEKQVELLLRRGADPNKPGGPHENILKTAEKSGNIRILQMLLEWGARDESEPDRWKSMLDMVGTAPASHTDIRSVRLLLKQCFERRKIPGIISSSELAKKVLDFAQYWLVELSGRDERIEVSEDTQNTPYLQVKIKSWPLKDTRVRRIVFRIKSRDAGLIKMPKLHREGPYHHSQTWFEVGLHSTTPTPPDQSRLTVQRNFCGSLNTRTHHITWDNNSNDLRISEFLNDLKPGSIVDVYARSTVGKHPDLNFVESVEVLVFYSNHTLSIPRPSIAAASEDDSGTTVIGTGEPLPKLPETPETPPPNGIEPRLTEATTWTLEKPSIHRRNTRFWDKVANFFTRCFK